MDIDTSSLGRHPWGSSVEVVVGDVEVFKKGFLAEHRDWLYGVWLH